MILWTFKLIRSVRIAIAGREHPGQLAWSVALGALLGMIPHGNLLAVGLLLFVLMLGVNHAMVALVGIGVSFLAPTLDPTFDALGRWCFAQPQFADRLLLAWQYPLVPWTDLNNTIVMGSFLVGVLSVGPVFLISFPLFRAWAPVKTSTVQAAHAGAIDGTQKTEKNVADAAQPLTMHHKMDAAADQQLTRFDAGHTDLDVGHVPSNHDSSGRALQTSQTHTTAVTPTDLPTSSHTASSIQIVQPAATQDRVSREYSQMPSLADTARTTPRTSAPRNPRTTRIAIGGSAARPVMTTQAMIASRIAQPHTAVDSHGSFANDQHKIDEALSYLLRQLRDSKDKDAA